MMFLPREKNNLGEAIADYETVDLEQTNRLAKMLVRTDRKYIVNLEQFKALSEEITDLYYVLEINGVTQFSYSSCYYDDHFSCYFEHHQARRQRFKVRTREYVDSGLKFFEIKLKGRRGITCKYRVNCDEVVMPKIRGEHLDFLTGLYVDQYRKPMCFELSPALIVNYKRCTLVSKQGGERVTVDYGLSFNSLRTNSRQVQLDDDFIIVETKSKDGKGFTDLALRRMGIRKARKCSKYCVGVSLTGSVRKNNNFLHTIKHARRNIVQRPVLLRAIGA